MTRKRRHQKHDEDDHGVVARAGGVARDNPVAAGGAVVMALTGCLIIANAIGLQSERHPAPFFITRDLSDRPVIVEPDDRRGVPVTEASALVLELQTALRSNGLYEGPRDGIKGPATERSIRLYERLQGRPEVGDATEELLALITLHGAVSVLSPSVAVPRRKPGSLPQTASSQDRPIPSLSADPRLSEIQRLLSDLGYGPLSVDGVMGENTSSAIQRFELDRGLPITGKPTSEVVARLEMVSGKKVGN